MLLLLAAGGFDAQPAALGDQLEDLAIDLIDAVSYVVYVLAVGRHRRLLGCSARERVGVGEEERGEEVSALGAEVAAAEEERRSVGRGFHSR